MPKNIASIKIISVKVSVFPQEYVLEADIPYLTIIISAEVMRLISCTFHARFHKKCLSASLKPAVVCRVKSPSDALTFTCKFINSKLGKTLVR